MFQDDEMMDDSAPGGDMQDDSQQDSGDGMHHHSIHGPDESGGYSSEHIHPDGRTEGPMHHDDYDEAKDHQDKMMGEGDDHSDDSEADDGGGMDDNSEDDMSPDDIAGSYGRKANC